MITLFLDVEPINKKEATIKKEVDKLLVYIRTITTTTTITTVLNATFWWTQLIELSVLVQPFSHTTDCNFGEFEFVYINTSGVETVKELYEYLQKNSVFKILNILALFSIKSSK